MASSQEPSTTPATPVVRASDAERERSTELLREHCAAGRITPDELSERLDAAVGASTVAQLDALTGDLPALDDATPAPVRSLARDQARRRVLHVAGFHALVNVACIVVWLASGSAGTLGTFWPRWILLASAIRLAFVAWSELGPNAASDEARLGRGGSSPTAPQPPLRLPGRR